MTPSEAHAILDAARAGEYVTQRQIVDALLITGDMAPASQPKPPQEVYRHPWGTE